MMREPVFLFAITYSSSADVVPVTMLSWPQERLPGLDMHELLAKEDLTFETLL